MSSSTVQRFKYGGRPLFLMGGILMTVATLSSYEKMTSGNTEWHLWSTKLPIIIPNQVMVGLWWVSLVLFATATLIAMLPAVSVIVDQNEISAQGPITRNYKTISFSDIRDVDVGNKTFSIHSKSGPKITINQPFMKKSDYDNLLSIVKLRSPQV